MIKGIVLKMNDMQEIVLKYESLQRNRTPLGCKHRDFSRKTKNSTQNPAMLC